MPRRAEAKQEAPVGVERVEAKSSPQPTQPEFEGDMAIKELRHRLSLDRELVPAPPVPPRSRSLLPSLGNIMFVVLVAAAAAGGIMLLSLDTRPGTIKRNQSAAVAASAPASALRVAPRLIVEGRQTFANEALALGISLNGGNGSEFALLTGLATGTRLSVGGPFGSNGWRVPARELGTVLAYAPKDFVGVMDTAIDLRMPNDMLVDSKTMRLEWISKQPEPQLLPASRSDREEQPRSTVFRQIDAAELDALVKRGQEYLNIGDIVSARLLLRRAASAGDAQAALTLGASFDPYVLDELGVLGFAPDVAQARVWYQQAQERGSAEASRRLARLPR